MMQVKICPNKKCKFVYTPDAVMMMIEHGRTCVCGTNLKEAVVSFEHDGKNVINQSDIIRVLKLGKK